MAKSESMATGIAGRNVEALRAWQRITQAARFFADRQAWKTYQPEAVPGILSDFTTVPAREVLNLIARTGQQYRIVLKEKFSADSLQGLKAVVDPDPEPPAPALRAAVLHFVNEGGTLVAGPAWGTVPGAVTAESAPHPRYSVAKLGKGTLAISKGPIGDPYLFASDAGILISHRHDLLRFWNGGPLSAVYSSAPDSKRAAVQMVFYSNRPAVGDTSVRIAGPYRTARLYTLDNPTPRAVQATQQNGAIEINLPGSTSYIALELEA